MRLKKLGLAIVGLLVILTAGFVAWGSITNPIMSTASAALQSDAQVEVQVGDWLVFKPAGSSPESGLIFYPGGKVDYRAYAPYARAVAAQGYQVVIPRMPVNLAVLDSGAAGRVIAAYPEVKHWAVGGHSLGGSMAASYAASHPGQVEGLVLLASYPAGSDNLSQSDLRVVSIYGTRDGLATGSKIDAAKPLLPANTVYRSIEGGNHAQFGDYGIQSGDGQPAVSRADQQAAAVQATVDLLRSLAKQN